ncbi:MAG: DNA repair protein RecO [Panacagrimonas sp.]
MTRAKVLLEPAWILKAAPYGDTSLLVEAITGAHGRVGLVARGVRSPRSRTRALLQSFRPVLLSWAQSGELGTLSAVESAGAALDLPGEKVFSGWYLNELLLRLLQRHEPHPVVFERYGGTLLALSGPTALDPWVLRQFELGLLAELGFGIELLPDIDPGAIYRYEINRGLLPATPDDPAPIPGSALIALRDALPGSERDLAAVGRLLKVALGAQLGQKSLETARMLRALRRGTRPREAG